MEDKAKEGMNVPDKMEDAPGKGEDKPAMTAGEADKGDGEPTAAGEKPGKKWWKAAAVFACLAVLGLGVGAYYTWATHPSQGQFVVDTLTMAQGIKVNGIDMSGMTREEALAAVVEKDEERIADTQVEALLNGERVYTFDSGMLGIATDARATVDDAWEYGRSGGYYERVNDLERAGEGVELSTSLTYDSRKVEEAALRFAVINSADPTDATARLTEDGFAYEAGQSGYYVDAPELARLLAKSVEERRDTVEVPLVETRSEVTEEVLKENTSLIGTYTTRDLGSSGRAYNIKKLAGIVNGTVIMPGDTWSINEAAGHRTIANGWKNANGITDGRFVPQPGGGVCQVSTTLYNAAIRAEVTVAERHPHSIPSTYVPIGMDATINSGAQDLKLTNDYDYPIYLEAYVKGDKVTCSVYGPPLDGYTVDFTSKQTGSIGSPATQYKKATKTPDGTAIPPGESVVWRQGRTGKTAVVTKVITYENGEKTREQFGEKNVYPAYREVVYYNPAIPNDYGY